VSEQLTLADMPVRLFACTPSRLAAFDCPRRYRFTYFDRPAPPKGPPWAHHMLGATAHVALAQWWKLSRAHRTPERGAGLVHENWQNLGFRDDRQSARAAELTAGWVQRYLTDRADAAAEPLGVERTVAMYSQRLALSGRVDRVDERAGEVVVVDYKTGRREPTEDDAGDSAALALYALGVHRTLRRDCRRVELHHLPTGRVAAFEHTAESLQRHLERAEATAQQILTATEAVSAGADPDEAFPARPAPECSWCDFRRHCPQGRAASPERPSWAGLPDGV
jgi:RecB family exonuclease